MTDERRDVTVPGVTARGTGEAYAGGIEMSANLWLAWGMIAIDAAAGAFAARRAGCEDGLGEETRQGLVSVCASAFSMEALSRDLASVLSPPQRTRSGGSSRSNAANVVGEVLKRSIQTPKRGLELGQRWTPVFQLRDSAVHYEEKSKPTQLHPSGGHTSFVNVQFSADAARDAALLLVETVAGVVEAPKVAVRDWAIRQRSAMELLTGRADGRP
ncbi:MAG: hypothetical protein ACJ74O_07270 [Frankiaceae bacterium]